MHTVGCVLLSVWCITNLAALHKHLDFQVLPNEATHQLNQSYIST